MMRTRLLTTLAFVPLLALTACGEPPEIDGQSQAILKPPIGGGGGSVSLPHNICSDLPVGQLFDPNYDTNLWGNNHGMIEEFTNGTMTGYLGIDPNTRSVVWFRVSYAPENDTSALYQETNSCKFGVPGQPQIQSSTGPLPHKGGNGPGEGMNTHWYLDPVADCPMLQTALTEAQNDYQHTCCAVAPGVHCTPYSF